MKKQRIGSTAPAAKKKRGPQPSAFAPTAACLRADFAADAAFDVKDLRMLTFAKTLLDGYEALERMINRSENRITRLRALLSTVAHEVLKEAESRDTE